MSMTRTEAEILDKARRVQYLAGKNGCTPAIMKRIARKIEKTWVDIGTLIFDDVEVLCMFLDEKLSYNLYWTIIYLAMHNKIFITKKDGFYYLDWVNF